METKPVKNLMAMEKSRWFVKGLKGILSLLMAVILFTLLAGTLRTAMDLQLLWRKELEVVLRQIIIDALILLALVEVFRTIMAYFTEGRVKVTFIVDTVLVVMLTEVISLWFKGGTWKEYSSIALLMLVLIMMRVITIQYSPKFKIEEPGEN